MAERNAVTRLAVFGQPVKHSLSPAIHRQFARQANAGVDYQAIEATPETFAQAVRELQLKGGRGCNITAPFKHAAWQLAQRCSDSARRAEAANTLVFDGPDDWYADSTDGRGLLRDLQRLIGSLGGRRILILGAGGAAAGLLGDVLEQAPATTVVANRSLARAEALAERFADVGEVRTCSLEDLAGLPAFDLLLNATSLGHAGGHPGLHAGLLRPGGLCYDLNYGAAAEPLRAYCQQLGLNYHDGLGMLVEQAALSFELWMGFMPRTDEVLRQLRETLQAAR